MVGKRKDEIPRGIKHWSAVTFFVMAGTSLLVGCGSVVGHATVHHQTTANASSASAKMANLVVNTTETSNVTSNESSPSVGSGSENNSNRVSHTPSMSSSKPHSSGHVARTSNHTVLKSPSTNVLSKPSGSSRTSGSSRSGTSTERNSSSGDSTKKNSKNSHTPTTPTQPSEIDTVKTSTLNNELGQLDYTGTNRSQFDSLVVQMAEGKTTPSQAKATIQALKPWNAIWNDAPGGPATYQFQVHDVEAYTFQTKTWSDSVTSKEFQAHGFLDDTAYQKFAVYWNESSQEYTVAMLAVGFYYYSQ